MSFRCCQEEEEEEEARRENGKPFKLAWTSHMEMTEKQPHSIEGHLKERMGKSQML